MGKINWNIDKVKDFVKENSECELITQTYIDIRTLMTFKCKCGEYFDASFELFYRHNKRQCNECGYNNIWKNRYMLNKDDIRELVNNSKDYEFIDFERDQNNKVFVHIKNNEGYKFRITKNWFDAYINDNSIGFETIGKNNPYSEYNVKLLVENNSSYKFIKTEYNLTIQRYILHIQDVDGYKYSIQKACFDSYLKGLTKNFLQFSKSNIYNEHNAKLLLSECGDYKFIKIERDKNDRYSIHFEDENNYKYKVLIGNLKKIIDGERGTSSIYKNGIYSEYNARLLVENNSDYIFIKLNYANGVSYISIQDQIGYKYYTAINNFITNLKNGYKFDMVNHGNKYTFDNIRLWLKINNLEYEILSKKYINAASKLLWKCDKGHEFKMNWNSIQQGSRCTKCNQSKGEKVVEEYLKNNYNNKYIYQYKFKNCKHKYQLPFDFAIFEDEEKIKLKCLVEYDGEFHYEPPTFSKDKEKNQKHFNDTQKRDKIKNEYCINNGIKLIRIPYWEFSNIEKILENELKNDILFEEVG